MEEIYGSYISQPSRAGKCKQWIGVPPILLTHTLSLLQCSGCARCTTTR